MSTSFFVQMKFLPTECFLDVVSNGCYLSELRYHVTMRHGPYEPQQEVVCVCVVYCVYVYDRERVVLKSFVFIALIKLVIHIAISLVCPTSIINNWKIHSTVWHCVIPVGTCLREKNRGTSPRALIWLSLSVLESYQNGIWASRLLISLAVCLAFCMAMSLLTSPSSPCLRCQPRQVGDPLGGQRKLYRYHGFSKKLNLDMATQSKSGTLMPC